MDALATLLANHWDYALLGFMIIEKIVKLSPCKWDDILVDGIKWTLTRLSGKSE